MAEQHAQESIRLLLESLFTVWVAEEQSDMVLILDRIHNDDVLFVSVEWKQAWTKVALGLYLGVKVLRAKALICDDRKVVDNPRF